MRKAAAKESTKMKTLAIAILVTGILPAFGGEIADYYFKHSRENRKAVDVTELLAAKHKSRSYNEVESTNHGITEIGIERTGCFGTCPAYTFIVKRDGTFRYQGGKYAERTGEFSGTIPDWNFHRLAQFIRDSGYMELEDGYVCDVTDQPDTFTTVVMNGKRKAIKNYARAGPTKLWAIEQLIDDLMAKAKWSGPKKPADTKK